MRDKTSSTFPKSDDVWGGGGRYHQFDAEEARACLAEGKQRIMVVGDSVSMQMCTWLQCALTKGKCVPDCSHRTWPANDEAYANVHLNECTENQAGA